MRFSSEARAWWCACLFCAVTLPAVSSSRELSAGEKPPPATTAASLLQRAANTKLHPRERDLAGRQLIALGQEAMSVLSAGLTDKRSIVQQTAIILLGEIRLAAAEDLLLATHHSKNMFTARLVAAALQRRYERLPETELLRRLRQNSSAAPQAEAANAVIARAAALRALLQKHDQEHDPALSQAMEGEALRLLKSEHQSVRQGAARALGLCAGERVTKALLTCLSAESEPEVIKAACQAIGRIRPALDESAGEIMDPLIRHADPFVVLEACAALHGMGYGGANHGIALSLTNSSARVRLRAAEILGEIKDRASVEELARATQDRSWRVRMAAIRALGRMKATGAVGPLRQALKDDHAEVRAQAAVALQGIGTTTGVVWPLVDDLQSDRPSRQTAAARALGRIRATQAVAALTKTVSHADLELACRSVEALAAIDSGPARSSLVRALADTRPVVAHTARDLLRSLVGSDPGSDPKAWPGWARKNSIPAP